MKSPCPSPPPGAGSPPESDAARLAATVLAWLAATLCLVILGVLGGLLLPIPQTDGTSHAALFLESVRKNLHPEPRERLLYLCLSLLAPLLVLGAQQALERSSRGRGLHVAGRRLPIDHAAPVALAVIAFVAAGFFLATAPVSTMHFLRLTLTPTGLSLGGAALAIWYARGVDRTPIPRGFSLLLLALCFGVTFFVAASYRVFSTVTAPQSHSLGISFGAVLYSAAQLANGQRPLLDLVPQYGLFGGLLKPVFSLVGLSVLHFTAVMTALQLIAQAGLALAFCRLVRDTAWRCLFVLTTGYLLGSWSQVAETWDPYFQYFPLRFVFPALFLLAATNSFLRPSPWRQAGVGSLAGLATIWNVETGLVLVGSWLALLLFKAPGPAGPAGSARLRRRLAPLALAILASGLGILLPLLFLCWQAGAWLPAAEMLRYPRIFYIAGLNALPLPLSPHPWMAVAAIYLLGIAVSLRRTIAGTATAAEQAVLLLCLMGVGLFSYYQSRSHDSVLFFVSWPALVVLFVLAAKLTARVRSGRLPRSALIATLPVALGAVLAVVSLLASLPRYRDYSTLLWPGMAGRAGLTRPIPNVRYANNIGPADIAETIRYLRAEAGRGDSVLILSQLQAIYYAETGLRSALPVPSLVETVLTADLARLVAGIKRCEARDVFVDNSLLSVATFQWGLDPVELFRGYRIVSDHPAPTGKMSHLRCLSRR